MSYKKDYITILNVVSCLAVIFLHTTSFWEFNKTKGWISANFIEATFYFAVPVFIMISSAKLIDYNDRYTTEEFFKKCIKKTVIPFVVWSIISIYFELWYSGADDISFRLNDIINSVIGCRYMEMYYFFLVIFGIYISIPVIGCIEKTKRKSIFSYVIVVFFIVNSLLPFIATLSNEKIIYNYQFSFYVCSELLVYVFIGYYIDNYEISLKTKKIIYTFGVLGWILLFFGTWYLSFKFCSIQMIFKEYTNVPCVLYSSAIYLLFKNFSYDKISGKLLSVVTFFSGQTFGIYLIHIFIIRTVEKCFSIYPVSFLERIIFACVIFIISGMLTKFLQKIPIIKFIIP